MGTWSPGPGATSGADTFTGNASNESVEGLGGADVLLGGGGDDTLYGDDSLSLTGDNDTLSGGAGNDKLGGGLGADILDGGEGSDTAFFLEEVDWGLGVVANLADPSQNTRDAAGDTYISIENLSGTGWEDTLTGDAQANTLDGDWGNDVLNGGGGNDVLIGGRSDLENFHDGDDVLNGGAGVDTADYSVLTWGTGVALNLGIVGPQDTVSAGMDEVSSIENVIGSPLRDNIRGTGGANVLDGGAGDDALRGQAGNDILVGGSGADILYGGLGDDVMYVDNAGDVTTEGVDEGIDTVSAGRSWAVASNIEKVVLTGTGDFNVAGNGLGNTLRGNSGDNWLNGSFGKDTLTGGGGRDSFIFNRTLGPNNIDVITDYDVIRDVIRIDNAVFTGIGVVGALSAGMFNTGPAATEADDRIIYDQATGRLFFDIDGVGGVAQQHFATLSTKPAGMSAGEFIII